VSFLELNTNALQHNISYFKKKLLPETKLLAVVKAFAYGHDAIVLSKILEKNKIDYLAVAYTEEGVILRENGIKTPILVLHAQAQNYNLLISHNLEPNIYSHANLEEFKRILLKKNLKTYPIHLKFNTGLNRLGFSIGECDSIIEDLQKNNTIKIQSIFSHLAASEDLEEIAFTKDQIRKFELVRKKFSDTFQHSIDFHLSNTSGIINFPEAHYNMVRLGIGMYGFGNCPEETSNLRPVASLKTVISQIHEIDTGESVGYNRGYIAEKKTRTATLPIGHADGISRTLGNGIGFVSINSKLCPIIGNVCMDMIMVDISDVSCKEKDEVIIFDNQETVNKLAKISNTISYEILTGISARIPRKII
jgi:alanine racemase